MPPYSLMNQARLEITKSKAIRRTHVQSECIRARTLLIFKQRVRRFKREQTREIVHASCLNVKGNSKHVPRYRKEIRVLKWKQRTIIIG